MKALNFRDFIKKHKLKNDTMKESQLQKIYNYPIYPRVSKIYFIFYSKSVLFYKTCFIVKSNKSFYFESFDGQLDKFPLNQLFKPLIHHN